MASSTNPPLAMPTPQEVLAYGSSDDGVSGEPWAGVRSDPAPGGLRPTQTWWRFWYGLYKRSQADIPFLVGEGLTALGAAQVTALELTADWNEITGGALNTGMLLSNFGQGFASWVWNTTASAKLVYPPTGCAIDALGTNAAYSLAAGKAQVYSQITATQFRSLQLG